MVIPSIPNTKCPSMATVRPDHVKNQGMKASKQIKCTAVSTVTCCHSILEGCVFSGCGKSPGRSLVFVLVMAGDADMIDSLVARFGVADSFPRVCGLFELHVQHNSPFPCNSPEK